MIAKKYIGDGQLFYSELYGRGVYEWDGETVADAIPSVTTNTSVAEMCFTDKYRQVIAPFYNYVKYDARLEESPLLVNMLSRKRFYVRLLECDEPELRRYAEIIRNCIPRSFCHWPVDLITLNERQETKIRLFVKHEYDENPKPLENRRGRYGLVFPYDAERELVSANQWVSGLPERSWLEDRIRRMAVSITEELRAINKFGYIYNDLHFSRVFFKNDGGAYLDYSNLVYRLSDQCSPKMGEYPLEFADALYYNRKANRLNTDSQNTSLAAMLFYLLLNRYAYDGDSVEHMPDDSINNHYAKMRMCLTVPRFIFDEGALTSKTPANDRVQELWDDLPCELKELFYKALVVDFGSQFTNRSIPTTTDWLDVFSKLGWAKGE